MNELGKVINKMIPLLIQLKDKPVLVVGAGVIATRRVMALIKEEALVTCISLSISEDLKALASQRLSIRQKKYQDSDLEKMVLVVAATDDPKINERIKSDCQKRGILCSRVDCHTDSDVLFPAVIRRGKLTIAVCTEGASPALTKEIARSLSQQYDENYIEKLELLDLLRTKILKDKGKENQRLLREMTEYSVAELRKKMKEIT